MAMRAARPIHGVGVLEISHLRGHVMSSLSLGGLSRSPLGLIEVLANPEDPASFEKNNDDDGEYDRQLDQDKHGHGEEGEDAVHQPFLPCGVESVPQAGLSTRAAGGVVAVLWEPWSSAFKCGR
jgi:hypothetical protein